MYQIQQTAENVKSFYVYYSLNSIYTMLHGIKFNSKRSDKMILNSYLMLSKFFEFQTALLLYFGLSGF